MSIVEDLNKINNIKIDIKQAIRDKGVEMEDNTPFAEYPNRIRDIETGSGDDRYDEGYNDGINAGGGGNPAYEVIYNMKTYNGTNYRGLFNPNGGGMAGMPPSGMPGEENIVQYTELNVNGLDTSRVTNMEETFAYNRALQSLDIDEWDTSNVTNMRWMFRECESLTQLDISSFNTHNVTDMSAMFHTCRALQSLEVSHFNTSKVWNMGEMFSTCNSLTRLDVSRWDTSKVNNMSWMFANCNNLQTLNLSNFNTNKVSSFNGMFSGCTNLKTLDIRNFKIRGTFDEWNGTYDEYSFSDMFTDCTSLRELHLENCSYDTVYWFLNYTNFPTGDIGTARRIYCRQEVADNIGVPDGWEFSYVTGEPPCPNCGEYNCKGICRAEGGESDPGYITSGQPYVVATFDSNYSDRVVGDEVISAWQISFDLGDSWHETSYLNESLGQETIYLRPNLYSYSSVQLYRLFEGASKLRNVNFYNFDFSAESFREESNIHPYIDNMFYNCSELQSLDLSSWDTSNVYNMYNMFAGCMSLQTLDISNWNTSNLDSPEDPEGGVNNFLANCNNLRELRLDNCDYDTIRNILYSTGFPTDGGVTRRIYCKEENAAGLSAPTNWVFSYVD